MRLILAFIISAAPAVAQDCPPVAETRDAQAKILRQLQALPSPAGASALAQQLWDIWTNAPDARAQALLDEGMRQRMGSNLMASRDALDKLVEYCPDYAEGYNQRAFTNFLRADYSAALYDLDIALTILPTHVPALSGKALTLLRMGRNDEAQIALREAVRLNPWIGERSLLIEPEGDEI